MQVSARFFGLLFPLVFFSACAKKPFLPEAPQARYESGPASLKEQSVVNIPVEVPLSEIEQQINTSLGRILFEDNSLEDNGGDNLMLKVSKRQSIAIEPKGGNLFAIRVPVNIWAKAGFKVEKFGLSVSRYEDTEFDIDMNFLTRIQLNPDWKISTSTSPNGYKWISEPKVKIGFFEIPITSIIEKIIDREFPNLVKTVDAEVAKINFRSQVETVWKSVQQPMLMNETYQAWLKISPGSVMMTPIGMKGRNVRFGLGIGAVAETFMGTRPGSSGLISLPELKITEKLDEKFQVGLMTEIPFEQMRKIALDQVGGKTYEFNNGKQKITILDMELFGSGDDLIIATSMKGSLNGKVFIKGKPYYDAASESLKMKDLDFDIETRNKLIKTADWLAHGKFLSMMEPYFSIPLSSQLEDAKKLIRSNLTGDANNGKVKLNGSLSDLRPGPMYVIPNGVRAIVYASGKLEVKLAGF
jgi:hypothetical protein